MGNQVLLACGMAAGPVFTLAYLLEGASRVDFQLDDAAARPVVRRLEVRS